KNVQALVPPPAPQLKAQISPLANMFNPEPHAPLVSPPQERKSDQGSLGEGSLSSSVSQSSSLDAVGAPRTRVRTIFPHQAGNNATLLSFDQGDVIGLLLQDERDGWLYGEMETTNRRGWFPSSYCRPYMEPANTNRAGTPLSNMSRVSLPEQEEEEPVLLPPPDYSDDSRSRPA
ncbi:hypothetical protein CRUP_016846, partial [Coryphaenoides rupestris]